MSYGGTAGGYLSFIDEADESDVGDSYSSDMARLLTRQHGEGAKVYKYSNDLLQRRRMRTYHSIIGIGALFSAIFFLVAYIFYYRNIGSNAAAADDDDFPSSLRDVYVDHSSFSSVHSTYGALPYFSQNKTDVDSIRTYAFLASYDGVVEPMATHRLAFNGEEALHLENDLSYYRFKVVDSDGIAVAAGVGYFDSSDSSDIFSINCEPWDTLEVSTIVYDSSGAAVDYTESSLVCLYVRRELRELSQADLDAALDAMLEIWSLGEEEGQATYGSNFHNSTWFTSMHFFNAGQQDGDHFHEGLGFLPQHVKMSNLFELAMQAVDPSVSLFWWDFTIESAQDLGLFSSPVFSEGVFGEIRAPTNSSQGWTFAEDRLSDARIQNGRWKFLHADPIPSQFSTSNAFGYMRGPWNMNPSPYVSRFSSNATGFPSCLSYYNWLDTSDFLTFMQTAENSPHASIHGFIGGSYGCDVLDDMMEVGMIDGLAGRQSICSKWGFYIKEMYRGNYLLPEDSDECSYKGFKLEDGDIDCGFVCNVDRYDDLLDLFVDTLSLSKYVSKQCGDECWGAWRDFICTGNGYQIFTGDHLEAASPADPSFWPIHPTQERLLQLRYAVGGFDEWEYPTTALKGDSWVCNHNDCYESSDGDRDFYDDCCYGHFEDDKMLDFTSGDRGLRYGPTNREVLAASDMSSSDSYAMPYVYSHFNFDHCSQNFDKLISTIYEGKRGRRAA